LMPVTDIYDEEEDLTQDPDTLASEAVTDLLDFCVDHLEVEIEGREAEDALDEEELEVSLKLS
jgi:hypothetical protein